METNKNNIQERIIANIRKIMYDKNLTQAAIAEYMGITPSQLSKVLSGSVKISLEQISNLALNLELREIDIITYPLKYVAPDSKKAEPVEAVLQIRLQKEKKDQILKLVFGDNNIEILNK